MELVWSESYTLGSARQRRRKGLSIFWVFMISLFYYGCGQQNSEAAVNTVQNELKEKAGSIYYIDSLRAHMDRDTMRIITYVKSNNPNSEWCLFYSKWTEFVLYEVLKNSNIRFLANDVNFSNQGNGYSVLTKLDSKVSQILLENPYRVPVTDYTIQKWGPDQCGYLDQLIKFLLTSTEQDNKSNEIHTFISLVEGRINNCHQPDVDRELNVYLVAFAEASEGLTSDKFPSINARNLQGLMVLCNN